jgi:predicted dehydrogenase
MTPARANVLHVGVIGLGPLWRKRYRPALAALRDCFRITAVYDQLERVAAEEARKLSCVGVSAATELLEHPHVEAVLLLDPQWHRLWALEAACRLGKPIFSCHDLDGDEAHAADLDRQMQARRDPLVLEMAPRHTPAFRGLKKLLDDTLGPARAVLCEHSEAASGRARGLAGVGGVTQLLSCCRFLLGAVPIAVLAGGGGSGFSSWTTELSDNRMIQMIRYRSALRRSRLRIRVIAERGTATAELPRRLAWIDAQGSHARLLPPGRPLGAVALEHFYRVVRGEAQPDPGLDELHFLLTWSAAAARSRQEGRRVEIQEIEI